MLDTLRHYALGHLARDPDEAEHRRRHLQYYLAMGEESVAQLSTREERDALTVLDRDIENIHAAREWALEHDPNVCLRLTGQLGGYWGVRMHPAALGWCEAVLQAAGEKAPILDRALTEQRRARQLSLVNRLEEAIDAAQVALDLYRQVDDHAGIANALRSLAFDAGALTGDLEQSRRYAGGSRPICADQR